MAASALVLQKGDVVVVNQRCERHARGSVGLTSIAVIVLSALVVSCAHGPPRAEATGGQQMEAALALASAPASTDSLRPSRESGLPPGGVAVTVTTAAPGSVISMPWGLATTPSGRSLDVFYVAGGGCTGPLGVHVVETASTVELWVLGKRTVTDGACSADLIVRRSTVELEEPLGTRTLLHPPSDPEWNSEFDATFPAS